MFQVFLLFSNANNKNASRWTFNIIEGLNNLFRTHFSLWNLGSQKKKATNQLIFTRSIRSIHQWMTINRKFLSLLLDAYLQQPCARWSWLAESRRKGLAWTERVPRCRMCCRLKKTEGGRENSTLFNQEEKKRCYSALAHWLHVTAVSLSGKSK